MAEFLVYKGPNWMDELDPSELTDRLKDRLFAAKYAARYQPGDIIAVYRDGVCRERPSKNSKMYIVRSPDMTIVDARNLADAKLDETDSACPVVERLRKYQIKLGEIPPTASTDLDSTGEATISKADIELALEDHSLSAVEHG